MCQPRIPGTVGAEPFSAKIRYTGPDDPDFPNLIKLTVHMPHMDGEQEACVATTDVQSPQLTNPDQNSNQRFTPNRHVTGDLHKTSVQL